MRQKTFILQREESMLDLPYPVIAGQTHYSECYKDKNHHNCAVTYIKTLEDRIVLLEEEIHDLNCQLVEEV